MQYKVSGKLFTLHRAAAGLNDTIKIALINSPDKRQKCSRQKRNINITSRHGVASLSLASIYVA
jgi:hypothetical protein